MDTGTLYFTDKNTVNLVHNDNDRETLVFKDKDTKNLRQANGR